MSKDYLISIRASFCTKDEDRDAKKALFQLYTRETDHSERRSDACKYNISDMISLLSTETAPRLKFCVMSTLRLPPVSIEHIDGAALVKNMMETKTEFLKYRATQLRQEESFQDMLSLQQVQVIEIKSSFHPALRVTHDTEPDASVHAELNVSRVRYMSASDALLTLGFSTVAYDIGSDAPVHAEHRANMSEARLQIMHNLISSLTEGMVHKEMSLQRFSSE